MINLGDHCVGEFQKDIGPLSLERSSVRGWVCFASPSWTHLMCELWASCLAFCPLLISDRLGQHGLSQHLLPECHHKQDSLIWLSIPLVHTYQYSPELGCPPHHGRAWVQAFAGHVPASVAMWTCRHLHVGLGSSGLIGHVRRGTARGVPGDREKRNSKATFWDSKKTLCTSPNSHYLWNSLKRSPLIKKSQPLCPSCGTPTTCSKLTFFLVSCSGRSGHPGHSLGLCFVPFGGVIQSCAVNKWHYSWPCLCLTRSSPWHVVFYVAVSMGPQFKRGEEPPK